LLCKFTSLQVSYKPFLSSKEEKWLVYESLQVYILKCSIYFMCSNWTKRDFPFYYCRFFYKNQKVI